MPADVTVGKQNNGLSISICHIFTCIRQCPPPTAKSCLLSWQRPACRSMRYHFLGESPPYQIQNRGFLHRPWFLRMDLIFALDIAPSPITATAVFHKILLYAEWRPLYNTSPIVPKLIKFTITHLVLLPSFSLFFWLSLYCHYSPPQNQKNLCSSYS